MTTNQEKLMYVPESSLCAESAARNRFDSLVDLLAATPERDGLAPLFAKQFTKLVRIFLPEAGQCTQRTLRNAAGAALEQLALSTEAPAIVVEFCQELDRLLAAFEKMCRVSLLVERSVQS